MIHPGDKIRVSNPDPDTHQLRDTVHTVGSIEEDFGNVTTTEDLFFYGHEVTKEETHV